MHIANGKISPSRFSDMLTTGRKKDELFGKTAHSYAIQLAMERIGVDVPPIVSYHLDWGNEHEIDAYEMYCKRTMSDVYRAGSIDYSETVCGEPDGLVGDEGMIEIKCPSNPANHCSNILNAEQVTQYYPQMQGYMWIADRQWCDFVSYDPRWPEELQLVVTRVLLDDKYIEMLKNRIDVFNGMINKYVNQIKNSNYICR